MKNYKLNNYRKLSNSSSNCRSRYPSVEHRGRHRSRFQGPSARRDNSRDRRSYSQQSGHFHRPGQGGPYVWINPDLRFDGRNESRHQPEVRPQFQPRPGFNDYMTRPVENAQQVVERDLPQNRVRSRGRSRERQHGQGPYEASRRAGVSKRDAPGPSQSRSRSRPAGVSKRDAPGSSHSRSGSRPAGVRRGAKRETSPSSQSRTRMECVEGNCAPKKRKVVNKSREGSTNCSPPKFNIAKAPKEGRDVPQPGGSHYIPLEDKEKEMGSKMEASGPSNSSPPEAQPLEVVKEEPPREVVPVPQIVRRGRAEPYVAASQFKKEPTFPELWGTFVSDAMTRQMDAFRKEARAHFVYPVPKKESATGDSAEADNNGVALLAGGRKRPADEMEDFDLVGLAPPQKVYVNPEHHLFRDYFL